MGRYCQPCLQRSGIDAANPRNLCLLWFAHGQGSASQQLAALWLHGQPALLDWHAPALAEQPPITPYSTERVLRLLVELTGCLPVPLLIPCAITSTKPDGLAFILRHWPGAQHQHADCLSRFSRDASVDATGARLDEEQPPAPPAAAA